MIIAQPLVAPAVRPPTIQRCKKMSAIKIGTTAIRMPAASPVLLLLKAHVLFTPYYSFGTA